MIREIISLFPQEFVNDSSMFDKLVRLQHYGLPTRLLDVTRNPLIALYFAVSDSQHDYTDGAIFAFEAQNERCKFFDSDVVSCMSNLSNLSYDEKQVLVETTASTINDFMKIHAADRLLQFIKVEKPHFMPRIKRIDLFKPVIVTPKMNNPRISAQAGAFILFGLSRKNGPDYSRTIKPKKFVIDKTAKPKIRARLESLGIDSRVLFPEIQSATKRVLEIYQQKVIPF